MLRIWAIAINTFREAVRDKVLYGVLAFACAVLVLTLALAELSLNQQRRVVLDVGLASISFFAVVIAIFLGSSLLYKEIERKTLYVILPKPIRRHEFLLGKYVGIAVTAAVFIAIMGAIQLWISALQAGAAEWMVIAIFLGSSLLYKEIERKTLYVILPKPIRRHEFLLGKYVGIAVTAAVFIAIMGAIQLWISALQAGAAEWMVIALPLGALAVLALAMWRARDRTAVLLPWALLALGAAAGVCATTDAPLGATLAALLLTFGEVLVLAAVALFFSSFSTPFLTGALSFGVWLVGRSADEMATMRSNALAESLKSFLRVLARIVPNFDLFVPGRHVLTGEVEVAGGLGAYLGTTMGYAVVYAGVLLVLAALVFRRRDFV